MSHQIANKFWPLGAFACWSLLGQCLVGAEYRGEGQAVIEADEVIADDLYVFGDEITVDGQVQGDLIAFGRLIRMNGTVDGDFIAAGQAIVISGKVGDDVRIAGQVLKMEESSTIADDLIVAGFSLELLDSSSVLGDLVYAGQQALVAGNVDGKLNAALANCEISGKIGGKVDLAVAGDGAGATAYTGGSPPPVSIPKVPTGLTIRNTAQIGGDLEYESNDEAQIEPAARIDGEIRHKVPAAEEPPSVAERAMGMFGRYGALLIVGLVVLWVAPRWTRRVSDNIATRPLISLGLGVAAIVGFIVLLAVILAAMIAIATMAAFAKLSGLVPVTIAVGLLSFGVIIVAFWFFASYLAQIVLSLFAGSWLLGRANPTLGDNRFLSLLVGLLLLAVISSVPHLGSVIGWLVVLVGLGALVVWMFSKRNEPSTGDTQRLASH